MSRSLFALSLLLLTLGLSACQTAEDHEDDGAKAPKEMAVIAAPANGDDAAWKDYCQKVSGRHTEAVTDRTIGYLLPAKSTEPTPEDQDGKSMYDRQLENVQSAVERTVTPGNLLAFCSSDSAMMGNLMVAAFTGAKPDAVKASMVLFIGKPEDSARVQPLVEAAGGKYIFVEAK